MELISQEQLAQLSSAVEGLNASQLVWASGYLSGLSRGCDAGAATQIEAPLATAESRKISILYGSQTGNSKQIAEELYSSLLAAGSHVSVSNLLDYRPAQLKKEQTVFFVISTQGNGEPPDDALAFFRFLDSGRAPELNDLEYAVLGLGDSSYDEFCQTGIELDRKLHELGAARLIERVDADIDFAEDAALWQKNLLEQVRQKEAAIVTGAQPGFAATATAAPTINQWSEANPYQAEVISLTNLATEDSEQEAYHLELAIDEYGQGYEAGDILAVLPTNQAQLVKQIIDQAQLEGDETVTINSQQLSFRDALLEKREISTLTTKVVTGYANTVQSADLLRVVDSKEQLKHFVQDSDLLDLLQVYPGEISAQQLCDLLRPLISRQYSIASSARLHTDEVHILVKPVEYLLNDRLHQGVTSTAISRLQPGDAVNVHIKSNAGFKLPANPEHKIIMIGAGTGVAPYRSFLFEREAQGATGNSWLFFGEQRFQSDFLYQTDWQQFLKSGVLERMDVAFSRDQQEKVYVQQRLLEQGRDIYQWLEEGASVYVCGDKDRMAEDVHQALVKIISEHSSSSVAQAEDYLQELRISKRYQRDVY